MPDTVETSTIDPEILIARARALTPLLRERAEQTERDRRVSREVIEAIRDQDIFRLLQAKRYGGFEGDFMTHVRIIIELGRSCGSTAWVAGLLIVHQWLAAQFPLETQDEIWGDDPATFISGSYAPNGTCDKADGGYRITGQWRYASGCDNTQWALLGALFPPDDDDGAPQPGFVIAGPGEFTIHDDWHTVGLCGTGSKTVVCDDQFIPRHRRVTFAELASGASPGAAVHGSALYKIPLLACIPVTIATPSLGVLQGAIDDFVDDASGRTTRGAVVAGGAKVSEFAAVQSRVGEAQACFNFARTQVLSDLAETHRRAEAGEAISVEQRIHNRLTQAFLVKLAVQGVEAIYGATGGAGLHLDHRVQRAWRDAHAVSHHVSLNWDAVSSMWGQHALGLEPKGQY